MQVLPSHCKGANDSFTDYFPASAISSLPMNSCKEEAPGTPSTGVPGEVALIQLEQDVWYEENI